jgi:hypothetical protein
MNFEILATKNTAVTWLLKVKRVSAPVLASRYHFAQSMINSLNM